MPGRKAVNSFLCICDFQWNVGKSRKRGVGVAVLSLGGADSIEEDNFVVVHITDTTVPSMLM